MSTEVFQWVIVIEVGILALAALLGIIGQR